MDKSLSLFDLVGALARRRYQYAERYFSALGLNHTEARLLTLLRQEGGVATQEALSNLLFVDRSNAGRALKALEREGYIARRKDDDDKRTNIVRMTEKGRKTATDIVKLKNEMAQRFFCALSENEIGVMVDLLGKVVSDEENA